jgi:NADH:ubiquinone oxidoreductase subunit E
MAKVPTRSPTHADVELARLASMGLEVEELDEGGAVALDALVEMAEDRGRPASHYLAALALATELPLAPTPGATLTLKLCLGSCQQWGALDLADHVSENLTGRSKQPRRALTLVPSACLDRCDQAPACEIHGAHGQLVIAPATVASLDEALDALA